MYFKITLNGFLNHEERFSMTHLKVPLIILRCILYMDSDQKGETPLASIM